MWTMQILGCVSVLLIKDKSQILWYPLSVINWTEEKKIEQKKQFRGRDINNLTDELGLCDDGTILSNKDKLLKICKLLCVEAKVTYKF